ncbi:MAG: hypothetical protein PHC34_13445 [Candidatus Gastranaerophilales bacterium]|nr:hypothetical protein [Candidatus Gastranaerophilales bacterium]
MTSPITNSLNTNIQPNPIQPAAESVWTQEINPGIPAAESNDTFNNSFQDPAAMSINPDVKQYAQASVNKMKNILIAAGVAVATGILFVKRKSIPVLKNWAAKIEKKIQEKKYFESLNKFFKNKKSVTTLDELKEYAEYAIKTPDSAIRRIKIHSKTLNAQSMEDVIQNVRLIAEDLVTTSGNKGKKPVVHIILNPEYTDKTKEIIEKLNSNSKLEIFDLNNKPVSLNNVIQKVEMMIEPSNKLYEKLIGEHSALINVGPPRYVDKKELKINTFWQWLTRPTPNKIPK